MEKTNVILIGAGGYGAQYAGLLLDERDTDPFHLVGIVDPLVSGSREYERIVASGVPVYASAEEVPCWDSIGLTVIAAPIAFHAGYSIFAMEHGSNVLCEKPAAATLQELEQMKECSRRTGKFCAIGFQWSYAEAILAAKRDILDGVYGKPVILKTHVQFMRGWKYFARNNWAGKLRDRRGAWILDSVAHNATAHYLHNEFFMLGDTMSASAEPASIQAELYRANDIENFDTAAIRTVTKSGAEMIYLASHSVDAALPVYFDYVFENGRLTYPNTGADGSETILGILKDGTVKNYGDPNKDVVLTKLRKCSESVQTGELQNCYCDTARSQLLTINFMADNVPINQIPDEYLIRDAQRELTYVPGLAQAIIECFEKGCLPSELGSCPWAKAQPVLDASDYTEFTGKQYS